jgi:hypothetical protein
VPCCMARAPKERLARAEIAHIGEHGGVEDITSVASFGPRPQKPREAVARAGSPLTKRRGRGFEPADPLIAARRLARRSVCSGPDQGYSSHATCAGIRRVQPGLRSSPARQTI